MKPAKKKTSEEHEETEAPPVMTVEIMEGCLAWLIRGVNALSSFTNSARTTSATTKAVRASRAKPKTEASSFKAAELKVEPEKPDSALDHIETVCLVSRVLQEVERKFPIFPAGNLQASMARHFLRPHETIYVALLDGPGRPGRNNATILLKALKDCV
jgi:hypothetical protein